jgi:hypothetical protein
MTIQAIGNALVATTSLAAASSWTARVPQKRVNSFFDTPEIARNVFLFHPLFNPGKGGADWNIARVSRGFKKHFHDLIWERARMVIRSEQLPSYSDLRCYARYTQSKQEDYSIEQMNVTERWVTAKFDPMVDASRLDHVKKPSIEDLLKWCATVPNLVIRCSSPTALSIEFPSSQKIDLALLPLLTFIIGQFRTDFTITISIYEDLRHTLVVVIPKEASEPIRVLTQYHSGTHHGSSLLNEGEVSKWVSNDRPNSRMPPVLFCALRNSGVVFDGQSMLWKLKACVLKEEFDQAEALMDMGARLDQSLEKPADFIEKPHSLMGVAIDHYLYSEKSAEPTPILWLGRKLSAIPTDALAVYLERVGFLKQFPRINRLQWVLEYLKTRGFAVPREGIKINTQHGEADAAHLFRVAILGKDVAKRMVAPASKGGDDREGFLHLFIGGKGD